MQAGEQLTVLVQNDGIACGAGDAVGVPVKLPAAVLSLHAAAALGGRALRDGDELRGHAAADIALDGEIERQAHRQQDRRRQADQREQHAGLDVPLLSHFSVSNRKP